MKVSNELKVGALTLVGIVALILGFYYLKGEALFGKTQNVYVLLKDAAGIVPANPVAMHRVQIGKVSEVSFEKHDENNVVFRLSVSKNVSIPKGSHVSIVELDLLGNKELRIMPPPEITGYIGANDTLMGSSQPNLFASMEPVLDQAEPLVGNIDSLIGSINALLGRNQAAIDASMASLQVSLGHFESIAGKVDRLVSSQTGNIEAIAANARTLTQTLADNAGKIDSIMTNFNKLSSELSALELEPVLNTAKSSLDEVQKLLAALNNAEGTLGKLVYDDAIANGLDSTLIAVNALITDLMANPKRYVSFSLIERKDKSKD